MQIIPKGEKREDKVPTVMKKVFDEAKEIYLQSEISKDKTQLYQFSEEDTLMLLEKSLDTTNLLSFLNSNKFSN